MTPRKISQFREGRLGRLSSHEGGIPVYWRTVLKPDCGGLGVGNLLSPPTVDDIPKDGLESDEQRN